LARPEASEIEDFRARVLAARDRLRAIPLGVTPRAGPTDPETGEAWDRLNVVGHMAELLPFWCGQLQAGLRGKPYGRDEEGYRRRRSGIESGHHASEKTLRLRVDRGCGRLAALLDGLDDSDLERPLNALPGRPVKVRDAIEQQLVGHLEAHVDQLERLS